MKLVSFLVGDAEWQQLKSTVLKVFPKALRTPQRRGVFEQSFEKEPMQEMLRMKINPSRSIRSFRARSRPLYRRCPS